MCCFYEILANFSSPAGFIKFKLYRLWYSLASITEWKAMVDRKLFMIYQWGYLFSTLGLVGLDSFLSLNIVNKTIIRKQLFLFTWVPFACDKQGINRINLWKDIVLSLPALYAVPLRHIIKKHFRPAGSEQNLVFPSPRWKRRTSLAINQTLRPRLKSGRKMRSCRFLWALPCDKRD